MNDLNKFHITIVAAHSMSIVMIIVDIEHNDFEMNMHMNIMNMSRLMLS